MQSAWEESRDILTRQGSPLCSFRMAREGLAGIRVGFSWLHRLELVVERKWKREELGRGRRDSMVRVENKRLRKRSNEFKFRKAVRGLFRSE
jgi:hypothetical protein